MVVRTQRVTQYVGQVDDARLEDAERTCRWLHYHLYADLPLVLLTIDSIDIFKQKSDVTITQLGVFLKTKQTTPLFLTRVRRDIFKYVLIAIDNINYIVQI